MKMQETSLVGLSGPSAACAARRRKRSVKLKPRQERTPRCRTSRRLLPSQRRAGGNLSKFGIILHLASLIVENELPAIQERPENIFDGVALLGCAGESLDAV